MHISSCKITKSLDGMHNMMTLGYRTVACICKLLRE